jgi:hypothetical protein
MFRIDESSLPARLLRLGDDMESECGLARGLGTVDLNDPAARNTAYAEGYVKAKGARGYGRNAGGTSSLPSRMMEPLPNCFSI